MKKSQSSEEAVEFAKNHFLALKQKEKRKKGGGRDGLDRKEICYWCSLQSFKTQEINKVSTLVLHTFPFKSTILPWNKNQMQQTAFQKSFWNSEIEQN